MEVPFIEENIRQDSSLHATKCLYDLGVSLKNNEQFNFTTDYDIFMVMTKWVDIFLEFLIYNKWIRNKYN